MGKAWKALGAAIVVAVVVAVLVPALVGEGLDRAEKWISIFGVFLSVLLALAGVWLAWRTSRSSGTPSARRPDAPGPGSATGSAPSPVSIRDADIKGIQIGDHNRQNNNFN